MCAESLRGAAALVRRVERQAGCTVGEARITPLRAADTSVVTVPDVAPPRGRLRVLAAGISTPGGAGACIGPPLLLPAADLTSGSPPPPVADLPFGSLLPAPGLSAGPSLLPAAETFPGSYLVAVVPPGLRYDEAAARLRQLLSAGTPIGAVLVAGDEGVLVANRLPSNMPVIDQVDAAAAASGVLVAVEVRPPGHALSLLTDPVALGARLRLGDHEAADAAVLSRGLTDYSNAVVGLLARPGPSSPAPDEPWVLTADGRRIPLRVACASLAGWPAGTARVLGTGSGQAEVDDLFAVDLAAAAEAATARRGSRGRAVLVASLGRAPGARAAPHADLLGDLLALPVRSSLSEPAAARLGALTTLGARGDAVVVDLGAGTIDVIGTETDIVAAGAGDLLTVAVAETLGIPRAAAEWVKRGPCLRVDGVQRFEGEDGSRGFLAASAPASAIGVLAIDGPRGLLPFDRRHGPGDWRAIRLRLKLAVLAASFQRAVRGSGRTPARSWWSADPPGTRNCSA